MWVEGSHKGLSLTGADITELLSLLDSREEEGYWHPEGEPSREAEGHCQPEVRMQGGKEVPGRPGQIEK